MNETVSTGFEVSPTGETKDKVVSYLESEILDALNVATKRKHDSQFPIFEEFDYFWEPFISKIKPILFELTWEDFDHFMINFHLVLRNIPQKRKQKLKLLLIKIFLDRELNEPAIKFRDQELTKLTQEWKNTLVKETS